MPTGSDWNYLESWKTYNPDYHHVYYNDKDMEDFIHQHYRPYFSYFISLAPVYRSDFFRYLIIQHFGGIWSDIDTECLKPFDHWLSLSEGNKVRAIIAVELDGTGPIVDWFSLKLQFVQWTFAAVPYHPLIQHVINHILYRGYLKPLTAGPHTVTGPTIWTDAILDYFDKCCNIKSIDVFRRLVNPIIIGDVLVLPTTAFSPLNTSMGGRGRNHTLSLVEHKFQHSWHNKV
ncbi:nucleotide-diphospho-sugar transferase [Globomyces pollinis-pini]|nr:nucleotide-diphospho-sugar transferase [Globomyces pollinis-pini]